MYRAMGSLAFVAAARAAYCVTRDKDDPTGQRRSFLPLKNNLGKDGGGLAYRLLTTDDSTPVVAWQPEPVRMSVEDALEPPPSRKPGPDPEEREEAVDWLRQALGDGPRPAYLLFAEAEKVGISKGTLKRAKRQLGAISQKLGMDKGWSWSLPERRS